MTYVPTQVLIDQVTDFLTQELGRSPTAAEVLNGLVAPWTLGNVHNTLDVTKSSLSVTPADDLQAALDQIVANGGGEVHMQPGMYSLTTNLTVSSNVRLSGVGSGGTIIDFGNGPYQIQIVGENPYATGMVSITSGGTAVVGVGTAFIQDMVGQSLFLSGQWYTISVVTDDLNLTIENQYLGSTLAGTDCVIATPNISAFLQGFTVQNSSTDLINVQYANNFGGYDVLSANGLSGIKMNYLQTLNWSVGFVDSCGTGMLMSNMSGATVLSTFLTGITAGGGYVCDDMTNSVIFNSSLDGVVGNGYDCIDCTNFGIDQVSVLNVTGDGFLLTNSGQSFSITNGIASGCTGDGIALVNTTQLQCATMQFSNNTGYGVSVDATSLDNLFANGLYATNTAGTFNDLGAGTLIRSNIGVADN